MATYRMKEVRLAVTAALVVAGTDPAGVEFGAWAQRWLDGDDRQGHAAFALWRAMAARPPDGLSPGERAAKSALGAVVCCRPESHNTPGEAAALAVAYAAAAAFGDGALRAFKRCVAGLAFGERDRRAPGGEP